MKGNRMLDRPSYLAPAIVAAAVALAGCPKQPGSAAGRAAVPRAERLAPEVAKEVDRLLDDIRGTDYLARVKAEEGLKGLLAGSEPDVRAKMVRRIIPILDEPQWGVRALGLKIIMEYGRDCPEAVKELVQVLGDMNVNAPMRDAVARTLARWTGTSRGYNAFDPEPDVKAAAERWRKWLEETGGRITKEP